MNSDREFWRRQPLLFGRVREDADVERWLAHRHGTISRAMVVASAGCTALALAPLVRERLDAVDINAAQIAFTEIKIAAVRRMDRNAALALFSGPTELPGDKFSSELSELAQSLWKRLPSRLPTGLLNAGRVDGLLSMLRKMLFGAVHSRAFVEDFLRETDPRKQAGRFDAEWNTPRWRLSTALAFNSIGLRLAFGSMDSPRVPKNFAAYLRRKIRDGLTRFPALENGYAWQSLLGRFPTDIDAAFPAYLRAEHFSAVNESAARVRLHVADVSGWLKAQPDRSIDFFALSNILELSGAHSCRDLLMEVSRVATAEATVVLRAILPMGEMPNKIGHLRRNVGLSAECAERDRSLICNEFAVYRTEAD